MSDAETTSDDRIKAAAQTYLYRYPLVYNLREAAKLFDGSSTLDVRRAGLLPRREPDRPVLDSDRTPGLQVAADGSVTITMQHDSPGDDRAANWLPAPAGKFRPILRSYQPVGPMLNGEYVLPKVRRIG